ncbi:MAG: hypothetical protein AAFR28_13300 [Pseudomonadota bacterium]
MALEAQDAAKIKWLADQLRVPWSNRANTINRLMSWHRTERVLRTPRKLSAAGRAAVAARKPAKADSTPSAARILSAIGHRTCRFNGKPAGGKPRIDAPLSDVARRLKLSEAETVKAYERRRPQIRETIAAKGGRLRLSTRKTGRYFVMTAA